MDWVNDLATFSSAANFLGAVCVGYALWHVWFAAVSDDYYGHAGLWERTPSNGTLITAWVGTMVMLVGLALIGARLTDSLLTWMPFSWGDETSDGWMSTRENLTYAVGGVFALAGLAIPLGASKRRLSAHHKELLAEWEAKRNRHYFKSYHEALVHTSLKYLEEDLAHWEREEEERQARESRDEEEREREWQERQRERQQQRAAVEQTQSEARERWLAFLGEMTEEELDVLWAARPLISWAEPMRSMTPEQQRKHWREHLELTRWPIPQSVTDAVLHRRKPSSF